MGVSLLLWPRGATAAVSALTDAALDVNVRYLQAAVLRVTHGRSEESEAHLVALSHDAVVGSRRSTTLCGITFRRPAAGPTCGPRR
jgi:hypothetical protein